MPNNDAEKATAEKKSTFELPARGKKGNRKPDFSKVVAELDALTAKDKGWAHKKVRVMALNREFECDSLEEARERFSAITADLDSLALPVSTDDEIGRRYASRYYFFEDVGDEEESDYIAAWIDRQQNAVGIEARRFSEPREEAKGE